MRKGLRCVTYGEEIFAGLEMAARWWATFNLGPLNREATEDLPVPVRVALDELIRYTLESLPGMNRYLRVEDALRLGFKMGFSFQRALTAGELQGNDPSPLPDEEASDSFTAPARRRIASPRTPEGPH